MYSTYDESGDIMKKIFLFLFFCLFILILYMGDTSIAYTKEALFIWFEKLVPSMFISMVMVRIFYDQGFFVSLTKPFKKIIYFIFRMDPQSFSLVLSSMLLGFPTGAVLLNEQTKAGVLPMQGARRLLYTCSFATPGFILLTCGSILFHSLSVGIKLMLMQWLCGCLFLLITRNTPIILHAHTKQKVPSILTSLTKAFIESGKTLYFIGGYLMLFLTISSVLLDILPSFISTPLSIFTEFSSGIMNIQALPLSVEYQLILTSMVLGFGGLCVHMQVSGMTNDIQYSYPVYFIYRILQMIICGIFAYIWFVV